jgi:hypothetical protein
MRLKGWTSLLRQKVDAVSLAQWVWVLTKTLAGAGVARPRHLNVLGPKKHMCQQGDDVTDEV